jgi:hypothetical protein
MILSFRQVLQQRA